MIKRIIAIIFIFFCTCVAWVILAATVSNRTSTLDSTNSEAVTQLWGSTQNQMAPSVKWVTYQKTKSEREENGKKIVSFDNTPVDHPIPLDQSNVNVTLKLEHRQKGLLWYSTYRVKFAGDYVFTNPMDNNTSENAQQNPIQLQFPFPASQAIYDNLKLVINGRSIDKLTPEGSNLQETIRLKPGESCKLHYEYDSQGLDNWEYTFNNNVTQVKNFNLQMMTDFEDIDFPAGS
ncbi:MAG: inner membrane CreD family protein, partial [Cyanobacteria bacterium]|nr:inner membrane CreD family protein [Cyanobacteriota bacterium]